MEVGYCLRVTYTIAYFENLRGPAPSGFVRLNYNFFKCEPFGQQGSPGWITPLEGVRCQFDTD